MNLLAWAVRMTEVFLTFHIPAPYLHGAAMLIKREVVNRVGPMPEIYFLYYEELDWCTAMTRAGYVLWYEPLCTVFHKESQSTGQQSPLRIFYLTRNRLLYSWRNFTGMRCSLSILYQMTVAAGKTASSIFSSAVQIWHSLFGKVYLHFFLYRIKRIDL